MITFKHRTPAKLVLEVGATVRIKKDLTSEEVYNGTYFNPAMRYYCGKTAKIRTVCNHREVKLDIDKGEWFWNIKMLAAP